MVGLTVCGILSFVTGMMLRSMFGRVLLNVCLVYQVITLSIIVLVS